MIQAICDVAPTILSDGSLSCASGWVSQVATTPFEFTQIDPIVATALFAGGFALNIVPWAATYGLSQLLKCIRG